jgi:DNA polymerase-3 subunit alpha
MSRPDFVHLHVHSEYSLLDGANRIRDLVQACVDDGQPALALTDHGNMFGAIELYKACSKAGVKPIIGCEVYVAREGRDKPHHRIHNPYTHLTLLARNETGYRNLMRMASLSYTEGYHFRPRVDREVLQQYAEGISALSGCLSGEICRMAMRDKEDEAERIAIELRDMYGPEHFWLELQRNGMEIQAKANETLVRIHQRTGIPLVATNDIHYLRHEDCAAQDVLLCINTGARRTDEKRFKMDTDTLFFRTREEMGHVFRDLPEALRTTMDVADQIDVQIEFGKYHLPVFTSDTGESQDALFDRLCEEGLVRRYGATCDAARARLADEAEIIREMGFVSYFLIVWDLIRWARENGIPVGPGRGSAAGSIIAYVLEITQVDPLHYGLIFERFLNSARVSMPDIDIDFCKEGRERVLQYTRERYGEENVAQIVTFNTMAPRLAIRDVGRVLDVPLKDVDRLAKKIPSGPGATSLAKALEQDPALKEAADEPEFSELFTFSTKLEGMARNISTHAAGVVIADKPITEYVPLCTADDRVATQWPAPQLEELGLLKMDYLGLRTLTILERATQNVAAAGETPPDLATLPFDDARTYELLNRGDTLGVFQLESEGMRKLITRLRPDCFEDLIAILALYRPGPLESGMDDMFIRRKHGQEQVEYPHPSLEEILGDTYGCLVYQEQVMRISNVLADFSLNEADNLRKAMGKKKPEIMQQFAAQFLAGAAKNGCAEDVAREVWDNMVKFGGYGFNKSHSTAYALISWQTAYMKAHHRVAFLAANMSCEMHSTDKIKDFADDARRADIELLPPTISRSIWDFLPERRDSGEQGIRFGLGAIKGTGQKAIDAVVTARDRMLAEDDALTLHGLCSAVDPHDVTRLTWEALIKAGAFEETGHDRGAVLAALDSAQTEGARAAADRRSGQGSLFGMDGGDSADEDAGDGIDDSLAFSRADTLRVEHEVLGFYLTGHPLEERAGLCRILSSTNSRRLRDHSGGGEVVLAGLVVHLKEVVTKAGKRMARFRLEDLEGGVNVTVFPRTWDEVRDLLVDDAIVVCRAKVEERGDDEIGTEVGLLLQEVMDVDTAIERFEGALMLNLRPEDRPRLPELGQLLERHRGPRRVFFEVQGDDGRTRRLRSAERMGVRIDASLAREIEQLLGRGRAKLARI